MNEVTKVRRLANLETRLDDAVEALEAAKELVKAALTPGDQIASEITLSLRKVFRVRGEVKMRLIELRANEE